MKVLLIDGNAVGYHAQQARPLKTADGEPTQAIFHSIKALWNLKKRYPDHTPLCLWDAHCQWRYDILPEYKGKRDNDERQRLMREEYREQRPAIKEAFDYMGITQVEHEGYEADDIAGLYARKVACLDDSSAVLYTGDKDWLQLVSENVIWHDIRTDKRVSLKNFSRETGFDNPSQFLQAKALHGDGSDNIGGVGSIGEKTADKLLQHFGSVKALLRYHKDNGDFEKGDFEDAGLNRARKHINNFCNNTNGGIELYKRNLKLMNLHSIDPPDKGFFRKRSKPSLDSFSELCARYDMTTLVTRAEQIINDMEGKS